MTRREDSTGVCCPVGLGSHLERLLVVPAAHGQVYHVAVPAPPQLGARDFRSWEADGFRSPWPPWCHYSGMAQSSTLPVPAAEAPLQVARQARRSRVSLSRVFHRWCVPGTAPSCGILAGGAHACVGDAAGIHEALNRLQRSGEVAALRVPRHHRSVGLHRRRGPCGGTPHRHLARRTLCACGRSHILDAAYSGP